MTLRLGLLGPFEAARDGVAIDRAAWRTRQTVLVLKRLIHERDRTVRSAPLIDAVWPDAGAAAGRRSLQTAIKVIRRVLEPGLGAAADSAYLQTEPDGYRFRSAGASIDADAFARLHQIAAAAERRSDLPAATAAFAELVALYRGDYLADEPYAEWAIAARELLREQWLDAIERLARLRIAAGQLDDAIALGERGLLADPFREPLYRVLIQAHAHAGRRAHAVAAYERCERVIRAGLGEAPDRATTALRDRVAREPSSDPRVAGARQPDIPFVGRGGELAALRDAWERAATRTILVAITGPAGRGKSALLRTFLAGLGQQRTIRLAAHEDSAAASLEPVRTAVESWLEHGATPALVQRLGAAAATLAPLLPRIRILWPECPAEPAPGTGPDRRADALLTAARLIVGAPPGIVAFDDLHWADPASVGWLAKLLRNGLGIGTLVVVTRRPGERHPDDVQLLIDDARDRGCLTEITLGSLEVADVRELVRIALPGAVGDLAERLHAATCGDPLFVSETVRDLVHRGLVYADATGAFRLAVPEREPLPLAQNVRDAIAARIRRLDDRERDATSVLAVLGRPARAEVIVAAIGAPHDEILETLDRLLERRLVVPAADGEAYEFAHPLFGPVAVELLGPGRRQLWHGRIAAVLDDVGGRLRHLIAAGAPPDQVVDAAIRAGDRAAVTHAYTDAIAAYREARDRLVIRIDPPGRAALARVLEQTAVMLRALARSDDAAAIYEELLSADDLEPLDRARIQRKLALALGGLRGRFADSLAALEDAEHALPDSGEPARAERARIAAARCAAHYGRAEYREAAAEGERALALSRGMRSVDDLKLELLHDLADAYGRLSRYDEAERTWRRGAALARAKGDPVAEARMVGGGFASVAFYRGQLRRALELAQQGARLSDERGLPAERIVDLVNLAVYENAAGDLRGAQLHFEEAIRRADAAGATYSVMFASVHFARNLAWQGDLDRARTVAERAHALSGDIGDDGRSGAACRMLSVIAFLAGEGPAALSWARRAVDAGERTGDGTLSRWAWAELADALLLTGDPGAAADAARRALERSREVGMVIAEGSALDSLGRALWALGDAAGAVAQLDAAELIRRRSEGQYHLLWTLWSRATTVLRDRPHERSAVLAEARDIAARIGAGWHLAQIDGLARSRHALPAARPPAR